MGLKALCLGGRLGAPLEAACAAAALSRSASVGLPSTGVGFETFPLLPAGCMMCPSLAPDDSPYGDTCLAWIHLTETDFLACARDATTESERHKYVLHPTCMSSYTRLRACGKASNL